MPRSTATARRLVDRARRPVRLAAAVFATLVGLTVVCPATGASAAATDYSALNTAPNGLTTRITYGASGNGSPNTTPGCTKTVATNPQPAVDAAAAGAVICVTGPGDYSTSTLTVNKAVTVRASGAVSVKNIVISGSNAVVDGFTVVGGKLGSPNYAIKFSGTGHKIINNVIRGRGIYYAIGCEQSAGCGQNVLISGNTITGVHNFGIYLWGGSAITVEKNNIFDLYQSKDVDDVDAMRAWGTNHIVRNNYIHDINGKKSVGSPHVDCYQVYQAGSESRLSSNITFENNYCVRITGQCFIAQNDQRSTPELHDYILRGNVCETYGWQSIEFDGIPNITLDNNFDAGVQVTVLNFANQGAGGLVSTNVKVRNNALARATSGSRYIDAPPGGLTDVANRKFVEPAVNNSYNTFIGSTGAYSAVKPADFTDYRGFAYKSYPPNPEALDKGTPLTATAATDVDGAPRIAGSAIDIGPFEKG